MNRRDLLKLFGAGASVVPLIGGIPELAAPAKLIMEPHIAPIEVVPAFDPSGLREVHGEAFITVDILQDGRHYRFQADTFITGAHVEPIDATSHSTHGFQRFMPGLTEFRWTLKGVTIGQPRTELLHMR